MAIVLTCDHRIVYGAEGARFLDTVKSLLEAPLRLLG
jgi:pyruvate dehydrogenase E2 component (dihydrolipoamide acetyltransferase)